MKTDNTRIDTNYAFIPKRKKEHLTEQMKRDIAE